MNTLRTPQYDFNWLNEPEFVGSFEDDHYVYFVFREIAVEFMNCGKVSKTTHWVKSMCSRTGPRDIDHSQGPQINKRYIMV